MFLLQTIITVEVRPQMVIRRKVSIELLNLQNHMLIKVKVILTTISVSDVEYEMTTTYLKKLISCVQEIKERVAIHFVSIYLFVNRVKP